MIGCAASISVSDSCSRCNILALASWTMTHLPHVQWTFNSWDISIYIYSVDTTLYVKIVDGTLHFYFLFSLYFIFSLSFFFYFLFLE